MALLLLRHALSVSDGDSSDDDPSNFFSVSDFSFFYLSCSYVLISNAFGANLI